MDEYQLSCPESMFKIHKFKTEEEAKALVGKLSKSGGVSHVGDEYWIGEENVLSTIFNESIENITQSFKSPLEFNSEWKLGRKVIGGECH